ncbi:hypothetical protein [Peribacillus asahii]|uniref:hypothetical protein n=1 Tax=Peribacillus asahii TaxID=228899 RepID=UPI0020799B19|nr:hypothetical protein [Peribacillus asahii]USK85740.1 hypothetical protein LIT35_03475 [Peribacillus asahii]
MPYSQKQWQDRIKDAQGNIVQEGTPFSAGNMNRMEQGIADAHAQLEEAARQKQTLIHGVSVLNGGVDAPVNIEIEGRTLIPMQNTVLDPLKYYVLADKKTKAKWADGTIQSGILKFTGKAERPTLIRVANFEGKILGSTLENPHYIKYGYTPALQAPGHASISLETQIAYDRLKTLDGSVIAPTTLNAGQYSQQVFSFDLIAEVERQLGRIPRTTVADKIQWLKDNIAKFTCNWHGFGSSVGGNKATFNAWSISSSNWSSYQQSHTAGTVSKLTFTNASAVGGYIDSNGIMNFLAYAEPSDGTTASVINTDYVELEIELKPEAILHAPRVPLYEVTQAHYDAINVTMLEDEILRRYPSVEGVTHLQNPYVMAEGENLIPPFNEWGVIHSNGKIVSPYELELTNTSTGQLCSVDIPCFPNTTYSLSGATSLIAGVRVYAYPLDSAGVQGGSLTALTDVVQSVQSFTTPSNAVKLRIVLSQTTINTFTYKNLMLSLGAGAKPFTPRNPSYALFETKLGKIGNVADQLYEQDGKYFKRKVVEDVVLDGSLAWSYYADATGFKRVGIASTLMPSLAISVSPSHLLKFNGSKVKESIAVSNGDETYFSSSSIFNVTIFDIDTGFAESYTPTGDEIKAYFNGWKVKTADGASKPTAWLSVVDGTDAPTQTLAYVAANKAPNYTPYKLSYVLATPKVEEIKSEGAISVNGLTQIEVGSGVIVREKAKVSDGSTSYNINHLTSMTDSKLQQRTRRIIDVYKNGVIDKKWSIVSDVNAHGLQRASILKADYDATAEYYVTYIVFDRQPFTSNPVNVSAQFANNIRAALEDATKKVEDNTTAISVNTNILYDVLKRLKAGGL